MQSSQIKTFKDETSAKKSSVRNWDKNQEGKNINLIIEIKVKRHLEFHLNKRKSITKSLLLYEINSPHFRYKNSEWEWNENKPLECFFSGELI